MYINIDINGHKYTQELRRTYHALENKGLQTHRHKWVHTCLRKQIPTHEGHIQIGLRSNIDTQMFVHVSVLTKRMYIRSNTQTPNTEIVGYILLRQKKDPQTRSYK